jgi:TonB family protein
MFTNKYFLAALAFSLVVHLSVLGAVRFARRPERMAVAFEGPREVSLDDFDPKQRPEVTYGAGGGKGGGALGFSGAGDAGRAGQQAMKPIPGYEHIKSAASAADAQRIASTQAPINTSLYEVEDTRAMDVIRVADQGSGRVRTTKEILAEPALELARGVKGTGGGTGAGFVPGGPASAASDASDISSGPGLAGLFGAGGDTISKKQMETRAPKATPNYANQPDDRPQETVVPGPKTTFFIAGQIADRKKLHWGLPRYPQWAIDQGASGLVRVTITVAPDGSVRENVILEMSSGYAVLDDAVKTVVRAWQFAPLDPGDPQVDETGTVAIKFVLE